MTLEDVISTASKAQLAVERRLASQLRALQADASELVICARNESQKSTLMGFLAEYVNDDNTSRIPDLNEGAMREALSLWPSNVSRALLGEADVVPKVETFIKLLIHCLPDAISTDRELAQETADLCVSVSKMLPLSESGEAATQLAGTSSAWVSVTHAWTLAGAARKKGVEAFFGEKDAAANASLLLNAYRKCAGLLAESSSAAFFEKDKLEEALDSLKPQLQEMSKHYANLMSERLQTEVAKAEVNWKSGLAESATYDKVVEAAKPTLLAAGKGQELQAAWRALSKVISLVGLVPPLSRAEGTLQHKCKGASQQSVRGITHYFLQPVCQETTPHKCA